MTRYKGIKRARSVSAVVFTSTLVALACATRRLDSEQAGTGSAADPILRGQIPTLDEEQAIIGSAEYPDFYGTPLQPSGKQQFCLSVLKRLGFDDRVSALMLGMFAWHKNRTEALSQAFKDVEKEAKECTSALTVESDAGSLAIRLVNKITGQEAKRKSNVATLQREQKELAECLGTRAALFGLHREFQRQSVDLLWQSEPSFQDERDRRQRLESELFAWGNLATQIHAHNTALSKLGEGDAYSPNKWTPAQNYAEGVVASFNELLKQSPETAPSFRQLLDESASRELMRLTEGRAPNSQDTRHRANAQLRLHRDRLNVLADQIEDAVKQMQANAAQSHPVTAVLRACGTLP